ACRTDAGARLAHRQPQQTDRGERSSHRRRAVEQFARGADVLVLPHTAMEGDGTLEVTPDMLARFLRATAVKQVVLTPRTRATLGHEEETAATIVRQGFAGALTLAND